MMCPSCHKRIMFVERSTIVFREGKWWHKSCYARLKEKKEEAKQKEREVKHQQLLIEWTREMQNG